MEQQLVGIFAGLQPGQIAVLAGTALYALWAIPTVLGYVGVRNSDHGLSSRAVWAHEEARQATRTATLMLMLLAGAAATVWLATA
jgi:hypothetical protein